MSVVNKNYFMYNVSSTYLFVKEIKNNNILSCILLYAASQSFHHNLVLTFLS